MGFLTSTLRTFAVVILVSERKDKSRWRNKGRLEKENEYANADNLEIFKLDV